MSLLVTVYRLLVAPAIAVHEPPAVSQRCQTYENELGLFSHEPCVAVSTEPSRAAPEIEGRDVFAGTAAETAAPTPVISASATTAAADATAILFLQLILPSSVSLSRRFPQSPKPA
jgi:hypothetical protein